MGIKILQSMNESEIKSRIEEIEKEMLSPDFWANKSLAREKVKEFNELKEQLLGAGKYEKGNAIMTIFAGAGGDDAEDFSRMLFEMYLKFIENKNWANSILHKNENDHGGYRNITFEISGKNAYGALKNESGVHRLVRISPFNAQKKRHTSFAMVEVLPKVIPKEIELKEKDVLVEFSKSSGPGGQNVNKRETAVRVVHIPTGLSVHSDGQRSQAQNKEKAMEILSGKLFRLKENERQKEREYAMISKTTSAEWGNQIRSYVLHPYKLVKDHRTGAEDRDVEKVFDGGLEKFIGFENN